MNFSEYETDNIFSYVVKLYLSEHKFIYEELQQIEAT